jgi:HPt (histidine-containing phosphotransfer) domain-containing protein
VSRAAPTDRSAAVAAIDRFRRWGGNQLAGDMIAMFAADMPRRIAEARAALDESNPGIVVNAAHSMKSSAAQFGATSIADLCSQLEEMGEGAPSSIMETMLEEIRTELDEFLEWLDSLRLPAS